MKCKFCGAEIKEGSRVCDYCGSEAERTTAENRTITRNTGNTARYVIGVIAKVIIALACVFAVFFIIFAIVVLNSDAFKSTYEYTTSTKADKILRNETKLIGQIISCDEKGIASLEYNGHTYDNIKILDKELIDWLNENNRSIDTVGICFSTDENGNISELGLLSADFFITEQDGDRYTAIRDGNGISFTSSIPLETGCFYSGYFSYPDMRLYQKEYTFYSSYRIMDSKCTDKESTTWQDAYTGKDITIYKICTWEKWYYCSKELYDAIQIDDSLDDYNMYNTPDLLFITEK